MQKKIIFTLINYNFVKEKNEFKNINAHKKVYKTVAPEQVFYIAFLMFCYMRLSHISSYYFVKSLVLRRLAKNEKAIKLMK